MGERFINDSVILLKDLNKSLILTKKFQFRSENMFTKKKKEAYLRIFISMLCKKKKKIITIKNEIPKFIFFKLMCYHFKRKIQKNITTYTPQFSNNYTFVV